MGVLIDGVPALLTADRKRVSAAEVARIDASLNLHAIRTSRYGQGEHLRPVNSRGLVDMLPADVRDGLWQAVAVIDASISTLEKLSSDERSRVQINDEVVGCLATGTRLLHRFAVRRALWRRATQVDLAVLVGLILLVASAALGASGWPHSLEEALLPYVGLVIGVILTTDAVVGIGALLASRSVSSLYQAFAPFDSIEEALLRGRAAKN